MAFWTGDASHRLAPPLHFADLFRGEDLHLKSFAAVEATGYV
jgi:hypothetical protein